MKPRENLPEPVLQRLILARLNTIDGVRVWRANTGAARTRGGRVVRFGVPGQADLTGLIRGGRRLEVEVKGPTGRVSLEQEAFGELIMSLGGIWVIARSLDDALVPVMEAVR
jgi:hypothetical protein